jgi:tetratricopeptide (TPR) repeat protein
MNGTPREKLCQIVAEHGSAVWEDAPRLAGLLQESCGDYRREVFALTSALEAGVPSELASASESAPRKVLLIRLAKRVYDELGLTYESAQWAVESWALALGIIGPAEAGSGAVAGAESEAAPEAGAPAEAAGLAASLPSGPRVVSSEARGRVEQLLRDAHINRMRGQWSSAETLCRQALALVPEDVMGLEMLGDLMAEKGELEDALVAHRKALALQPEKPSLEEKIARIVLLKEEDEREREAVQLMLNSPRGKNARKRNVTLAILLSVLCAGAGQLFNRQYVKGAILLTVWVLSMFGWGEALKLLLGLSGPLPRGETVNDTLAVMGLIGFAVYVYSLLDASSQAGKRSGTAGDF